MSACSATIVVLYVVALYIPVTSLLANNSDYSSMQTYTKEIALDFFATTCYVEGSTNYALLFTVETNNTCHCSKSGPFNPFKHGIL